MEEHCTPPADPSFGVVNADSITEGIQSCHVAVEESRLRLDPLLEILDAANEEGGGGGGVGHSGANGVLQSSIDRGDYNDGQLVHSFLECVENSLSSVDILVARLADSGLVPLRESEKKIGDDKSVYLLMASNCVSKASEFIGNCILALLEADSLDGSGPLDGDHQSARGGEEVRIQPCMARLAELALRVVHIQTIIDPCKKNYAEQHDEENVTPSVIIEAYTLYQRRCLRTRSKAVISSLAELRRVASSQECYVSDLLEAERRRQHLEVSFDEGGGDDDGGGDGMDGATVSRGQPHAQAITVVLGEASSLIQPLAAWNNAISPRRENFMDTGVLLQQLCEDSMKILDKEAKTLTVTVGSWFGPDQRGVATLDCDDKLAKDTTKSDLLSIESSLEEMAFLCQVISRYCLFSEQMLASCEGTNNGPNLQNLLTEQSLHYSTLETRLATLQFNQAVSLASPQLIELDRPLLQVPSIVEDAHFVCVRALERAAGTRSERAVWTVGHWICEVWGFDLSSGAMGRNDDGVKGVYRALMEGIGCIDDGRARKEKRVGSREDIVGMPSKSENAFAAALLEASEDQNASHGAERVDDSTLNDHIDAPPSGGISSFFSRGDICQREQSKVDAEFCALNGISAAETACSALSGLFAELVEEKVEEDGSGVEAPPKKSPSMLTFARDELASHSRSYHNLLRERVRSLVTDLCGGDDIFDCDGRLCLQNLRLFVEKEVYNLDSSSFHSLEGEDRLEAEMIGPVRQSQVFEEIEKDKCDTAVVLQVAEAMSWKSAEIILQVLLRGNTNFNEWGAMLLSKQIRLLQNIYCGLVLNPSGPNSAKPAKAGSAPVGTSSILNQFERVNQAVSILQLEKPSDWLAFAYRVGESGDTNLTVDEIQKIMSLRVDFTEENIARVCMQIK